VSASPERTADHRRRQLSVALGNPFRSFGQEGEGLESVLAEQRAGRAEPIVFVLHLAAPRIEFRDRGKTPLVIAEQKG
jgi:hypothetical protein